MWTLLSERARPRTGRLAIVRSDKRVHTGTEICRSEKRATAMAKFNKDGTSRLFHLMMLVPAGLIFLLAIISLSTLADVNKEFRDEYDKLNPRGDATCILFAEDDSGLEFSDGDSCKFSIAGGGILAAVAVLYIVVLVVKAILGISV